MATLQGVAPCTLHTVVCFGSLPLHVGQLSRCHPHGGLIITMSSGVTCPISDMVKKGTFHRFATASRGELFPRRNTIKKGVCGSISRCSFGVRCRFPFVQPLFNRCSAFQLFSTCPRCRGSTLRRFTRCRHAVGLWPLRRFTLPCHCHVQQGKGGKRQYSRAYSVNFC